MLVESLLLINSNLGRQALYAWGANAQGQLGTSTTEYDPKEVGSSSWTAVAAGQSHVAAI